MADVGDHGEHPETVAYATDDWGGILAAELERDIAQVQARSARRLVIAERWHAGVSIPQIQAELGGDRSRLTDDLKALRALGVIERRPHPREYELGSRNLAIIEMWNAGASAAAIGTELEISDVSSVYRAVRKGESRGLVTRPRRRWERAAA